jgi:hypothetical protein
MSKLLSRDEFREQVFDRDGHRCIICFKHAVDAHHIIERRLWKDEGYYLENGASLCEIHHRLAETGHLCPDAIRGILEVPKVYPEGWDINKDYDKWGKVLKKSNEDNTKYPSTSYLNFSPSIVLEDEQQAINLDDFIGVPIVITIKMDGSNTKITNKSVAARNGIDATHKSFDFLKKQHIDFKNDIPDGIEVFGEWLYAKHSIQYESLNAYYQMFGLFNKKSNIWLSWIAIKRMSSMLGLKTVPVLVEEKIYNNKYELKAEIERLGQEVIKEGHEGLVIRYSGAFHYGQFSRFVAKYVRPNHVQTDVHWSQQQIIKNKVVE